MLPLSLKPLFWSYRFEDLNTMRDQGLIIKQVLNHGNQNALRWLFSAYPARVIHDVFSHTYRGEYSRKSLLFWQRVFGVTLRDRADVVANARIS